MTFFVDLSLDRSHPQLSEDLNDFRVKLLKRNLFLVNFRNAILVGLPDSVYVDFIQDWELLKDAKIFLSVGDH